MTIKRTVGDKIEFTDYTGGWVNGVLVSGRVKDEQGRWGYYIQPARGLAGYKFFAYTSFVRTPK